MKTVWKWIIGIVVGLIVLALIVGAVFLVRGYLPMHRAVVSVAPFPRGHGEGFRGYPMQGYGMHGYPMMGWGMKPFGGLFAGLFGLGILVLVVLGIVWLVKGLRTPRAAAVVRTCGNCGKPVQEDWRNCPYCGKKL